MHKAALPRCSPLTMCCWLACTSESGVALVMLYCSQSFSTAVLPHSDELLLCSLAACHRWNATPGRNSYWVNPQHQPICDSADAAQPSRPRCSSASSLGWHAGLISIFPLLQTRTWSGCCVPAGKRSTCPLCSVVPAADLIELLHASQQGLMQQLAVHIAAGQEKKSAQTVGSRFRDQLKDLIARLDQ